MPTGSRAGRQLHYRDVGTGHPLLLLHAFPLSGEAFAPQLVAPPPGLRLLVPDQRGFGQSTLGEGGSTMDELALDALAVLDAAGVQAAAVGGVSMGGYVALALARLDPGRVRGLVLIDTQATADDEATKARREAVARQAEEQGAAPIAEALTDRLLAPTAPADLRARVRALMAAQAPAAIAAASRGMALRGASVDLLARFSGPCLVLVGALDTVTPVDKARQLAGLVGGARLEVIDGAGHLSNLEKPALVNAALARFATWL